MLSEMKHYDTELLVLWTLQYFWNVAKVKMENKKNLGNSAIWTRASKSMTSRRD